MALERFEAPSCSDARGITTEIGKGKKSVRRIESKRNQLEVGLLNVTERENIPTRSQSTVFLPILTSL
jgi:hypothetical protein